MIRRGFIKVINKRNGTFVQEELNGGLRLFKQAEWAKELEKRGKMTDKEWRKYGSFTDVEPEAAAKPKVKGAKPKDKSTQKKVVDKSKDDTLIEDDDENDPDEIKA